MAFNWLPTSSSQLLSEPFPSDAIQGGYDHSNTPMFIGRARHKGRYLPARIAPSRTYAYIGNYWRQFRKSNFDVLLGQGYAWAPARDGKVPPNAVGGCSSPDMKDDPLYIGRARHAGLLCLGKVHPSNECIYLLMQGKEISLREYEVLVHENDAENNVPIWQTISSTDAIPSDAVQGGSEEDGTPMYVGRANFIGHNLPAKILPGKALAFVAYDGKVLEKQEFDVLTGRNYTWVAARSGEVPANAVSDCSSPDYAEEPLYIGRGVCRETLCIGPIHPRFKCIFLPLHSRVIGVDSYEVLVNLNENRDNESLVR